MAHDLSIATEPLTVHVMAGPNGAGTTTFATELLPNFVRCREFLNADLIAAKTTGDPTLFDASKFAVGQRATGLITE